MIEGEAKIPSDPAYEVFRIVSSSWRENCYLVVSRSSRNGVIIDPGSAVEQIWSKVCEQQVKTLGILLTHAHYDHVDGLSTIRDRTRAPVHLHKADSPLLRSANAYALGWRLPIIKIPAADVLLKGDETLEFQDLTVSVVHLPGHSPGSVAYAIGRMLFVGDTVLPRDVGRVDLTGGDWKALLCSVRKIIACMTEQSTLYPGHGEPVDLRCLLENNEQVRRCLEGRGSAEIVEESPAGPGLA
jgi:glyoxylase-like metal-dependent hydrolase (beta-lactamase superfamily II)